MAARLVCVECGQEFERPGTRGPRPKYCSLKCSSAVRRRKPERKAYEREYRRIERASGKRRTYEFEYYRRPEVLERYRLRWHDPEYREREYARRRVPFSDIAIPRLYTGHRWFDMARAVVGRNPDEEYEDFGYTDEMGEAILALLEGRDMKEAVSEFRKREFIPRHRTVFFGEWQDNPDQQWKYHQVEPRVPSAEDEAVEREQRGLYLKTQYHHGSNGRPMRGGRDKQQPSRRRKRDGKSWLRHAAA